MHYQPLLELSTGSVVGYEALARWQRPGHGLVPPGDFIPLAEKSTLICDIGRWALYEAAAQAAVWDREGLVRFAEVVAFNPGGAFGAAKHWPLNHFAALARRFIDGRGAGVLVLCGPGEVGYAREIARLAWRTLPYAFQKAGRTLSGPVAFELVGPDGDAWTFRPDEPAATTVRGPGVDLCNVAGRRAAPDDTALVAEGPDGAAVLELVRTYA